jgi:hypothetical protein
MFRTRDFILFFTVIVFLLVAIAGTVVNRWLQDDAVNQAQIQLANAPDIERGAVLYEPETISRAERLAQMREKIAASGDLVLTNKPPEPVATTTEDELPEEAPTLAGDPMRCPGYQLHGQLWSAEGVQFDVVEGSRLVFREQPQVAVPNSTSSELAASAERDVLLQLPIAGLPGPARNCLPSDVVGVAQDGSLIRNNEIGLYSVFGQNTLIGYALDGFPIYGVSDRTTDQCGGTVVAGEYRYFLSAERTTILNCFAGQPRSFQ